MEPPPAAFPSGAGGLVSTASDFVAFARMLLGRGALGDVRVLSERSVEAMTHDQLTPAQRSASDSVPMFLGERGWGFGVSVFTGRGRGVAVPGAYGWDGGLGTWWCTDPSRGLIALLFTQRGMNSPEPDPIPTDFFDRVGPFDGG
ncbi:MAG TPA: serine hydrolase domain-containing protein [Thermoplasmata archaeon]|nr:serine hydrolase domain-containing protein [Thermoplasmata archaeon]